MERECTKHSAINQDIDVLRVSRYDGMHWCIEIKPWKYSRDVPVNSYVEIGIMLILTTNPND